VTSSFWGSAAQGRATGKAGAIAETCSGRTNRYDAAGLQRL